MAKPVSLQASGRVGQEMPRAIHPERRETPAPAGGGKVPQNPPVLLWPAVQRKTVRYSVQLSQSPRFPKRGTISAERLRWAVFNPHRKLDPGTWFWRYGVSKGGRQPVWSEVFQFEVARSARVMETPAAGEIIASCPEGHPRLWLSADELEAFRKRVKGAPDVAMFSRRAGRFLGEALKDDDEPPKKGETEYEIWSYRKWASKALAGEISSSIQWLAPAYLMTGDERYGREAVRRGLHVAKWDPEGFTAPSASDFADGSCMRVLGQVYDSCYDLLTEEERGLMREAMRIRANRFFDRMANGLETRVFSAHVWQHILLEFAEVAFATLGEIPEAETWATYIYEIWVARVPLLGGADGGWANGNNYFGTNVETLLSIPALFNRLGGVDLLQHPWYRNAIEFSLYTWPPGSSPDGFGDGGEKEGGLPHNRLAFVDYLGRKFQNPYAAWYVKTALQDGRLKLSPMMAWERLRSGAAYKAVRPKSPGDLPQAAAFRDIGVVAMHTDLANISQNLMVAFRSSPYGAFNHMHADQNSFNILFGGKRVFQNSGYYISYNDDHFRGWYKHTRGHNTVLIDGKGQTFNADGYGWVTRFLDGRRVSYCQGDASQAYGDAGLTRFRRHVVLLRPQTVVIYDDLEADHDAEWSWLLHSGRKMTVNARLQRLQVKTRTARGRVDLLGSDALQVRVDDAFDPPALNWRGRKLNDKVPKEYPKQWHGTAVPSAPAHRYRFLAVIQIRPVDAPEGFVDPVLTEDGGLQVGDWLIEAELDAAKKAGLVVRHRDGNTTLAADRSSVKVGKKVYKARSNISILVETTGKDPLVQRSEDQLPDAAR